jgi:hypothetical protein
MDGSRRSQANMSAARAEFHAFAGLAGTGTQMPGLMLKVGSSLTRAEGRADVALEIRGEVCCPGENDLEGHQDQGGKHGGQAGMPKPVSRPSAAKRHADVVQEKSKRGATDDERNGMPEIKEHMEVIGADGVHVGTVDRIEGNRIKLTKKDSGEGRHKGHHHYIDRNLVADVEGNQVRLSAIGAVAVTMEEEK